VCSSPAAQGGWVGPSCARMRPRVRVTLTYVSDEEAASSIVKEVESGGGSAAAVPMDLTDHSSIERAVSEAASRHGGLDVLVANAVRWPTDAAGPLAESDPVVWQTALRANLEGTAATVRAAWPLLAQLRSTCRPRPRSTRPSWRCSNSGAGRCPAMRPSTRLPS